MIVPLRMFRARYRGSGPGKPYSVPPIKGVLIFGVDNRAKPGIPFDVSNARFEFKADNGTQRTYLGSFLRAGKERQKIIDDKFGMFLGKASTEILFVLPNGEQHRYDLLREMEVTEGTEKVQVTAASMSAIPSVKPHG